MIANPHIKLQGPVLRHNKFLSMLFLYVIYAWVIIHTYDFQLAEANAYAGMQPWKMTFAGWVILVITLPLMAFMATRVKGNPSDFFVIFYSAIPVISFFTLTSTSGKINNSILLPSLLIIVFPLLAIWGLKYLIPKITWRGFVPSIIIELALLGIFFAVIIFSYVHAPTSAGLDIISSNDRRLEGRELYTDGSLIAYGLAMCMNGLAPYLSFRGAVKGRRILALTAFGSAVFFYWLLGVKAPIIYVLLSYLLGFLVKGGGLPSFVKYFLAGIIGLYFLVIFEWWFFDGFSIIADYGYRRLFPMQAQIQGFYLDFLMGDTPSAWSWLIGIPDRSFQVTYYVGEKYFGDSSSNANTNAFLYAFAFNGFLGYFFSILFVSTFLVVLDRLYRSTQNPVFFLIGFVYGMLVTEQAFSTAILSSGVGLLFLLTLLEKYDAPIAATSNSNKSKINRVFR